MQKEDRASDNALAVELSSENGPEACDYPSLLPCGMVAGILALSGAMLIAGETSQDTARPPRPTPGPAPAVRVPRIVMRTLSNGVGSRYSRTTTSRSSTCLRWWWLRGRSIRRARKASVRSPRKC